MKRKRRQRTPVRRRPVKRRTAVRRRKTSSPKKKPRVAQVVAAPAPPPVAEPVAEEQAFPPGWHRLTPMQQRVLRLVAANLSTKAIAEALGASPHTVQAHRVHIAIRLGLRGRTALHQFVHLHHELLRE
jgi:DNA-binding CsgD family transcriptional regulator